MKKVYMCFHLFGMSLIGYSQTSPIPFVSISEPSPVCAAGNCIELTAEYSTLNSTTDYVVNSIPYAPVFPFSGGINLNNTADDIWSPSVNLPFSFNFYGINYDSILVGSNGVATFDQTNQSPGGYCNWNFTQSIPNTNFPIRNAIYGVYQDTNIQSPPITNPAVQNINYYVANIEPYRVFVINFNELPQYVCGTSVGLQTSQIVLYETTNVIEVYVGRRAACPNWNSGSGLIGVQNQAGTNAIFPQGRNTGTWSANEEAWRFTPNGAVLPTSFTWYRNGVMLPNSNSESFTVCPEGIDTYSLQMSVLNPNNAPLIFISNEVNTTVFPEPAFGEPMDTEICFNEISGYTVDLTDNNAIILNSLNSGDFEIAYYETLTDAENFSSNFISNPTSYVITSPTTIYAAIQEVTTSGCIYVKPFELILIPQIAPPTGPTFQTFELGQTLANLVITGDNITWYDAPTGGNVLASDTVLVDNTTYYATQTISGCESNRSVSSNRLAITVSLSLGNNTFSAGSFTVYPNPFTDQLTVSSNETMRTISVYNAIGQQVMVSNSEMKQQQINTTALAKGVYFLRVNTENESATLKIIKN